MGARWRDMFNDGVEKRLHRPADVLQVYLGETLLGARINHREIHLLISGVQRAKQIPYSVKHLVWLCIFAIHFVDDYDRLGTGLQRLAQHETGLSLRTVRG